MVRLATCSTSIAYSTVSTVAGVHESAGNEDGVIGAATADFPQARFNNPTSLVAHSRDLVMVVDASNSKVRAVSEEDGFVQLEKVSDGLFR